MYYSNGNYAAFSKPLKPLGIDNKKAYLIGGGLAIFNQRWANGREKHMYNGGTFTTWWRLRWNKG